MDSFPGAFILAGFFAQVADGSLGMGYGVICSVFLLSLGQAPAVVSASVHLAKVFTTASSAYCHYKEGNVDKQIMLRLAVPGIAGGVAGAYFLSHVSGELVKPWISAYLLVTGLYIVGRAFSAPKQAAVEGGKRLYVPLGLTGGVVDAIGGGGWGPVVTTSLVARGGSPRHVIGTVNAAEFFVAGATSVTFLLTLGAVYVPAVVGLVIGGLLASPIAARLCKQMKPRFLMATVGILITVLSASTIFSSVQSRDGQSAVNSGNELVAGTEELSAH